MKNALIALLIAVIAFTGGTLAVLEYKQGHEESQTTGDAIGPGLITQATNPQSVAVSASASTQLIATSSSRLYAAICNDSNSLLFINFGNNAQQDKGIRIQSGECYEIDGDNPFTGAVNAIASSTAATSTIIEVKTRATIGN